MADQATQIIRLAAWVGRAIGGSAALFADFNTEELGIDLPAAVVTQPAVVTTLGQAEAKATRVQEAADELDTAAAGGDELAILAALLQFGVALGEFARALDGLVGAVGGAITPATIPDATARAGAAAFAGDLAKTLSDFMLGSAITDTIPQLGLILRLLGLLDWSEVQADPANGLSSRHVRRRLQLDRFKDLVSDPEAHLRATLGWGAQTFDPLDLFTLVTDFFDEEADVVAGVAAGEPFLQLGAFRLERDSGTTLPGLRLSLIGRTDADVQARFDVLEDWDIVLAASLRLMGQIGGQLTPPLAIRLVPPSAEITGETRLFLERSPDARPFELLGGTGLLTVGVTNMTAGVGLLAEWNSTNREAVINPLLFAEIDGLTLRIGTENADGFVGALLGAADIDGEIDLGLEWRADTGLRVSASGGIEIALPIHKSLGPITFETVYLALRIADNGTLALETSAALTGNLGPLTAAVDRVGGLLELRFAEGVDAKFGPFDLALGFKPPNGVGLAVDAGVVKGGGYLYIDVDKGEYAGALELVFSGFLTLKAIGLITTRQPDGSPGFSLLVIITAEFGTPIQLGFGFVLAGVGGLLGLNRSMRIDALAEGVRTGAINSVMFPENVIENAPRIISDLRAFFPQQDGVFLIGPMIKLGWGSPPLITASLGIIIEIPGNIAIVGVVKVVLPNEDAEILKLQVNLIGAIEFDKARLFFFAALFESRVLFITLEGEMGLLVSWGADAAFVVTVGGFHPQFNPPPLPFPSPRRVALSILDESWGRIRVSGYFAITSNTVQLGARADLFFGFDEFKVEGYLSFDALFQFNPFFFIIQISCGVELKVFGIGLFGITLRFSLEGPTPWRAKGYGELSFLFFSIKASFDFTWGEEQNTALPPIEVLPLLADELANTANWLAVAPAANNLLVALRTLPAGPDALVLHPLGVLVVSQRLVPLAITIDKVGTQKPSDVTKLDVEALSELAVAGEASQPFAIAQFQDFTDAEKLSKPAFQPEKAGVQLTAGDATLATGQAVERHVRYETVILDVNRPRAVIGLFGFIGRLFTHFLGGAAVTKSSLSQHAKLQFQPFTDKASVTDGSYVVASNVDNTPLDDQAVFTSEARAREDLDARLEQDPALSGTVHVIPGFEVNAV
jgi:hypothetical protein